MTLDEYQMDAARTISAQGDGVLQHALHGLSAEVGELHGIYQKVYQGHPMNTEHIQKEAGDILWMLAELCTAYGWSLSDIARMNIEKLRRRYPDGFDPERSLHRTEGDV